MRNTFVPSLWVSRLPLLCLGLLAGCGGVNDGYEGPRGEVSGKMTYKGAPVPENSIVMFQGGEGKTFLATASTKAGGAYQLMFNGKRQIPAVKYRVQILPPPPKPAAKSDYDPIAAKTVVGAKEKVELPFPQKYTVYGQLKDVTVEAGKNVADFDMVD